jgi:hypothetical protein
LGQEAEERNNGMALPPTTGFEAGYVRGIYSFPTDPDVVHPLLYADEHPLPPMLPCPRCGRTADFAGVFDGHALRIYCRCGEDWEPDQTAGQISMLVEDFDGNSLAWFPEYDSYNGNAAFHATVAEIHDNGANDGWYPNVSEQDEALLEEMMRTGCAVRAFDEQQARQHAHKLNYVMSTAEEINQAWRSHLDKVRAQRRIDRGSR